MKLGRMSLTEREVDLYARTWECVRTYSLKQRQAAGGGVAAFCGGRQGLVGVLGECFREPSEE
jgi:hypothetical protein